MLPQAAQTHKPDFPPVLRQYRLARERNLPENPRLVPHRELAEAAQLQREAVHSQIVQQRGFQAPDHCFYDVLGFLLRRQRQRLLNPRRQLFPTS